MRYPEERRLATVMFADVRGFTALAERLDFEEVSDLIKEIWFSVDQVIEAHGGYIDKHIGDAVMAVWGAPHAREDDAERAVKAALALQDSFSQYTAQSPHPGVSSLKIRVGINTGPVLTSYVGVRGEYTVIGDTVNVANRLEQVAEPGTIVISASTYHLVRGAFQIQRLPAVTVKGKTGPLSPFLVTGLPSQPTRVRYRSMGGLETHMVGREAELNQLEALFRRSLSAHSPTFGLIHGEAGLGKSRLIMEFTSQLETEETSLTLLSARGLAQISKAPFYVWKSLWHARFSLFDNDPPETYRQKFMRGIQILWGRQPGQTSAIEAAHLIGSLIGLDWPECPYLAAWRDDAEGRTRRAFELTRELFRRVRASGPTVLIFDDLQWADEGSLSLLAHLLKPGSDRLPMLVLGAARPELLRRYRALARVATVITLKPLPINDEVVSAAYPVLRPQPEPVLTQLARRAEGNPYFLEELVKSLLRAEPHLESQSAEAVIAYVRDRLPDSLHAVLQARLDALSPDARSVALLASVVGRVFWVGAVVAAARQTRGTGLLRQPSNGIEHQVEEGLGELVQAELAFPRAGSAFTGEKEYIFKHSILREVAYGLIPHKYGRQYHLAVAQWLSSHAGPDFAASVAEHFEQAGAYAEAARQYELAAQSVASRGSRREAEQLLNRARQLREQPPAVTGPLPSLI